MIEMKRKQMSFQGIQPIEVDAKLSTTTIYTDTTVSHIHDQCEIYINVAGDVSFMVEDRIYPISPGDVIVTRPFEYHQCIYHSIMPHEHFWILFSSKGNEDWLDLFFARPRMQAAFSGCWRCFGRRIPPKMWSSPMPCRSNSARCLTGFTGSSPRPCRSGSWQPGRISA